MKTLVQFKTTIPPVGNSIDRSPLRCAFLLIPLVLVCFGLSPAVQAVTPAPDGFYPNYNTAEGMNALLSLNTSVGIWNTAIGAQALLTNTGGSYNTAVGLNALYFNTANYNTAVGSQALQQNTTANYNTAVGSQALQQNTTGVQNTATGVNALLTNNGGSYNTANGVNALYHNTIGTNNTACGNSALFSNTSGFQNTANGDAALFSNIIGTFNVANGQSALYHNASGFNNVANGQAALFHNTTGNDNTAVGDSALFNQTTAIENTAVGTGALAATNANFNTALGWQALTNSTTGLSNIAVGARAGNQLTSESFNIDIGHNGIAFESNTIRIGSVGTQNFCYIAGTTAPVSGQPLQVGSGDQIGVAPSSRRFKQDIKPMEKASETIFALKPVSFRYKKAIDPDRIPQFGLVAEDVEKVNPDLVAHDHDGKPYTVRYEQVNAMLLNEFLKEHRTVEEQGAMIARQQKQIEALSAGLQKVSAQLESSKPAPQVVNNP